MFKEIILKNIQQISLTKVTKIPTYRFIAYQFFLFQLRYFFFFIEYIEG